MEIDLNSMSLRELRDLQARVNRAIASFEERKKKEVLAEVEELVREKGFSLAEITGMATTRKRAATRSKSAAKYVNPENPNETWGGRGRRPGWFTAALAAGVDPETLRA